MTDLPILPDGSSFFTASLPLPKDHWLYAPRPEGWDVERDEAIDMPRPILTRELADLVRTAARYAIRASTMCGKEADFDPDAMVQNFAYALCGPCGPAFRHNARLAPARFANGAELRTDDETATNNEIRPDGKKTAAVPCSVGARDAG